MRSAGGVWFILMTIIHYGQCCGPAEIGQMYTITSTASIPSRADIIWEIHMKDVIADLYYRRYASDRNKYPHLYMGTRTTLTINSVNKSDGAGFFRHIVDGIFVYNCTLPVYKEPNVPACEPLTVAGNQIKTKCSTAEVFPPARCEFRLKHEEISILQIKDETSIITYTHTEPQPGVNEYYSTSCTLQYPVNGLKPGDWTTEVTMFPYQTGVSVAQGTTGRATNTIILSVPTVNIDITNCPKALAREGDTNVRNGYIRRGGRASCLCTPAHPGNPPGTIEWRSSQGENFVTLSQSEDAAIIQINAPDGPSSASLTFQRSGPIYLCPSQQTNIDITCQVPENSFSPAPLFTIREGNSNNLLTKAPGDIAWSKSVKYKFTRSGQHTFTCRAENAVFNDIFTEAPARAMQVYAPPAVPPSIQVTGQSVMIDDSDTWVKQGSDISVSCSVGEAYPLVTSVAVTCGLQTSTSGQLSVSGVSGDELRCRCTVDHETKGRCNGFNLNKDIIVQTAYGPTELTISFANGQLREVPDSPLNLCSSEGLDLTVICAVKQSDVRPGLTIGDFTLTKPNKLITQQIYLDTSDRRDYRSVNKLKVTTGGRHTLVCEAKNPKFSGIKKTKRVTIEVREPPKHPPKVSARSSKNNDVLLEGDDVTVACDVSGGHPPVQSVTLICDQHNYVTSNGTSAQLTLNQIKQTCKDINCTCQATHVTGCYNLMGFLPLTVLPNNFTKSGVNEENIGPHTTTDLVMTAIGSVVGTLILVAAIALIVFVIRREKAKHKNRNKDKDQNIRDSDPNYLTINYSDQASVPSSDGIKQKTERTYQNQAFCADTEATEPDLNVYTYIKD